MAAVPETAATDLTSRISFCTHRGLGRYRAPRLRSGLKEARSGATQA